MTVSGEDHGETENGEHNREIELPNVIARTLILAFLLMICLVIVTNIIAIYNSGDLSGTIDLLIEQESAVRESTRALLNLEEASVLERSAVLSGEVADPGRYSYLIAEVSRAMESLEDAPPEFEGAVDALRAAVIDRSMRHERVERALSEGRIEEARAVLSDARALNSASAALAETIRRTEGDLDYAAEEALSEARILDISLGMISVSMVLTALLGAYIWKKMVDLH